MFLLSNLSCWRAFLVPISKPSDLCRVLTDLGTVLLSLCRDNEWSIAVRTLLVLSFGGDHGEKSGSMRWERQLQSSKS
jgi:hypothetical protein